jgi:hypothetical protein
MREHPLRPLVRVESDEFHADGSERRGYKVCAVGWQFPSANTMHPSPVFSGMRWFAIRSRTVLGWLDKYLGRG